MVFKFKNIGIVESAEIEVGGLTVLTGLNDTGKSFLSKAIFSVIKTVNESGDQQRVLQSQEIQQALNVAFTTYRQFFPLTPIQSQSINPNVVWGEIVREIQAEAPSQQILDRIEVYKQKILALLETTAPVGTTNGNDVKKRIEGTLTDLKVFLARKTDQDTYFKNFFNSLIVGKLFQGQFNTLGGSFVSEISIKESDNDLLNISVDKSGTTKFQLNSIFTYKDATLIDTPTIIQLYRYMLATLAFGQQLFVKRQIQQRSELPYHYVDIAEKVFSGYIKGNSENLDPTYKKITDTIKGEVVFDSATNNILYVKDNKQTISSFNIATGIKSFGLIQLLIHSDAINQNSILIVDEPEVHLHPQWEIEYAKSIIELVKIGIPIIVSTHSPYFIKALTTYANKYEIEKSKIRVYNGQKDELKGTSIFSDITNHLDVFLDTLAKPMQTLFLEG